MEPYKKELTRYVLEDPYQKNLNYILENEVHSSSTFHVLTYVRNFNAKGYNKWRFINGIKSVSSIIFTFGLILIFNKNIRDSLRKFVTGQKVVIIRKRLGNPINDKMSPLGSPVQRTMFKSE